MNLQTFKAFTMAEALQQVKTAMGHDAVILHTRTYQLRQWLGLRRREMVEVTAGRGIIHNEQPPDGVEVHSLQLWVNLPAADKMV